MHSLTRIKHAYKTEFLPRKSFMLEKGDKNNNKKNSISKRLIYISIHKCTVQPDVSTSPWKEELLNQ